ncbi:MAG: GDP-mannose 4,6-dehydratase [Candidatus Omnitrophica bacterium]|nr:GDP-mannose 4,6-dehydratase [Candidatus Omnitrophota bacterium]
MKTKKKEVRNILVTGGAGFIGTHLCTKLLELGFKVYAIDNFATSKRSNITNLLKNKNFSFFENTIMNRPLMDKLIKKCDMVYHLAAAVGVKYILQYPLESLLTNLNGTENVLEFADKYSKKVIITSTSEVYGKHGKTLFKEDDDAIFGSTKLLRWSYAEAKAIDEFLALAYFKQRKLPIVIVRLFNTVGPLQLGAYGMVLPRLIQQAIANKPLTVYGTGEQTRTFTYIDDVVGAMIALGFEKKCIGEVFNIGNYDAISIKDLALKIKKATKCRASIKYVSYEKAYGKFSDEFEDMMCRIPDIRKIHKAIGYMPHYNIDQIIKKTIEYFKDKEK